MATDKSRAKIAAPAPENGALAALLSFLVPGLGQVLQGRIGKGLLFFFAVYALFFYGMYLGSGSVTLTNPPDKPITYRLSGNVYLPDTAAKNNPYNLPNVFANLYNRPQYLGQFWVGVVAWPALYHYYFPDKADHRNADGEPNADGFWEPIDNFEKTPSEEALNAVHTSGSKLLEIGWVYTVIAGVLNIMVIYDAFAGPAFPPTRLEGA